MTRPAILSAAFAAALTISGGLPAHATTSAITDAFIAATAPAYEALQRADALALDNGARVRRFAEHDSASQASAADELRGWQEAERRADVAAAHSPSIDGLGPVLYPFSSVVFPFEIHGHVETDSYRAALAQLTALGGAPDFDPAYVAAQSSALRRLAEVYTDYIKNGDAPGLRLLAVRNLPRVRKLLAELARV